MMAERVGFEPYRRGRYPIEPQLASLISENECRGKMPRASIQRLESGRTPYFFSRMTASISKAISLNRRDLVGGIFTEINISPKEKGGHFGPPSPSKDCSNQIMVCSG